MDTGAISHLMNQLGVNSSIVNWRNFHSQILVGDGSKIQVMGSGSTYLSPSSPSVTSKNILCAPNIIKILVYIHQFTYDNSVFIEFDPFGFSACEGPTNLCSI